MSLTPGRRLQWLPPVLVLLTATAGAWVLATGDEPPQPPPNALAPTVKTLTAKPKRMRLPVHSQGVVQPAREIDLTAPVQGRVVALHDGFVVGGRFKAGEILVSVAADEYDLAIVRSETRLAEARRALAEEQAAAAQAQKEWRVLGEGKPTPLSLREPQLQEAKARLKLAVAELAHAKLQRSHCELRAPFSGRVKERLTGVGQIAEVGKSLGRIYADDAAEIRLPLSQAQIAYLSAPEHHGGKTTGAQVLLSADLGGTTIQRRATIVRREGVIDQATGLEYWVARLEHPGREPALLPGAFVSAEIEGRELDAVYELPHGALNAAQEALLVDADGTVRIRRLQVLRSDAERVWVGGGLSAGDRVVVSGMDEPVDGMAVIAEPADGGP